MDFSKIANKERFFSIWQNKNRPDLLSPDDGLLLEAVLELPEYFDLWESGNPYGILNRRYDRDPFFHAVLFYIVLGRIKKRDPPETAEVYEHLIKKHPKRRILDGFAIVLADEMKKSLDAGTSMDVASYGRRILSFKEL